MTKRPLFEGILLHATPQEGARAEPGTALLPAISFIMGDDHPHMPGCVCMTVAAYAAYLADTSAPEQRQRLLGYLLRIANSNGAGLATARRWAVADYAMRVALPAMMEEVPALGAIAARMRELPQYDGQNAAIFLPLLDAVRAGYVALAAAGPAGSSNVRARHAAQMAVELHYLLHTLSPLHWMGRLLDVISVATPVVDRFELLDRLLAIGDVAAAELTPERAARAAALTATKGDIEKAILRLPEPERRAAWLRGLGRIGTNPPADHAALVRLIEDIALDLGRERDVLRAAQNDRWTKMSDLLDDVFDVLDTVRANPGPDASLTPLRKD